MRSSVRSRLAPPAYARQASEGCPPKPKGRRRVDAAGELRLAGHPGSAIRKNKFPARRKPGGFDIVNEGSVRTLARASARTDLIEDIIVWQNIQSACVTSVMREFC